MEGSEANKEFILGYQVHAWLLQFDDIQVQISFLDWRVHQGVELPFVVSFNDGTRTFLYHCNQIVIKE